MYRARSTSTSTSSSSIGVNNQLKTKMAASLLSIRNNNVILSLLLLTGIGFLLMTITLPTTYAMSLDRLGIDRNELRDGGGEQIPDENKIINTDIVVDDRELQPVLSNVDGTTDAFVLLPAGGIIANNQQNVVDEEEEDVNKNSIEDGNNQEGSQQMIVEEGGDMIMMESNDEPAMQIVELPTELAAAIPEMINISTEHHKDKPIEMIDEEPEEILEAILNENDPKVDNVNMEKTPEKIELILTNNEPEILDQEALHTVDHHHENIMKEEMIIPQTNEEEEHIPKFEISNNNFTFKQENKEMAMDQQDPLSSSSSSISQQQSDFGAFADTVEAIEEKFDKDQVNNDKRDADLIANNSNEDGTGMTTSNNEQSEMLAIMESEPESINNNEVKETESALLPPAEIVAEAEAEAASPSQIIPVDTTMIESENLDVSAQPEVIVIEPHLAPEITHTTENEESAPPDVAVDKDAVTAAATIATNTKDSVDQQQNVVLDEQQTSDAPSVENVQQIVGEPDREPEIEIEAQPEAATAEISAINASESEKNRLDVPDATVVATSDDENDQLAEPSDKLENIVADNELSTKDSVEEIIKDELIQLPSLIPLNGANESNDELKENNTEDNKEHIEEQSQQQHTNEEIKENDTQSSAIAIKQEKLQAENLYIESNENEKNEKIDQVREPITISHKEEQILEDEEKDKDSIPSAVIVKEEEKPVEENDSKENDIVLEHKIEQDTAESNVITSSDERKDELSEIIDEKKENEMHHVADELMEESKPIEEKHETIQKDEMEQEEEHKDQHSEELIANEVNEETNEKLDETIKNDELTAVNIPVTENLHKIEQSIADEEEKVEEHIILPKDEIKKEEEESHESIAEKEQETILLLPEEIKEDDNKASESINEPQKEEKEEISLSGDGVEKIDNIAISIEDHHHHENNEATEEMKLEEIEEHSEDKQQDNNKIAQESSQVPTVILADPIHEILQHDTEKPTINEVSKVENTNVIPQEEPSIEIDQHSEIHTEIPKIDEDVKKSEAISENTNVIKDNMTTEDNDTSSSILTTIIAMPAQTDSTSSIVEEPFSVAESIALQPNEQIPESVAVVPTIPVVMPANDLPASDLPASDLPAAIEEQMPTINAPLLPSYNTETVDEEPSLPLQEQVQQSHKEEETEQHKLQPVEANVDDDDEFNSHLRRYDGAQVWRIVVQTDKDRRLADELQNKYDAQLWKEVKQEVDYLLKPQMLADAAKHIRASNLSRIVLIDNLQHVIEVENPPEAEIEKLQNRKGHRLSWQAYHRVADIHDFFDYMAKTYPDICSIEVIGYSVEKRPLKILKISNGNTANPGIWIDGGMHAREWIGPAAVTYIANQLVEGWDDLPDYMKNINWYIHAVANPDGYEYSHTTDRLWRKNMRSHGRACPGVDLNRNFGYKWGGKGTSANPCSQTYRGSKAFSEPESFYISKYISNAPRDTFQAYLTFHSYGQYILYPWGYDYAVPADRGDLDRVARQAGTGITKSSGGKYTVGPAAMTLYPAAGGSDDWAKGIAGIKYTYTIEMGDTGRYGFILPASYIEQNGKDGYTFVETVARAIKMGSTGRRRRF